MTHLDFYLEYLSVIVVKCSLSLVATFPEPVNLDYLMRPSYYHCHQIN